MQPEIYKPSLIRTELLDSSNQIFQDIGGKSVSVKKAPFCDEIAEKNISLKRYKVWKMAVCLCLF